MGLPRPVGGGRDGTGHISSESGVLAETPYSFKTRFENEKGTNPEELIAAAHAGCFTMALAFGLQLAGFTPTELSTEAAVTLDPEGKGFKISKSALTLRAKVPNLDDAGFAKIAGEMVSLSAVEAMAAALWPQAISVAVSTPDARKGERIVLLTTQKDADRAAMQRQAKATGASELAVPATVHVVDKVPLLGSGKTDYVAATGLAKEIAAAPAQEGAAQETPAQEVA